MLLLWLMLSCGCLLASADPWDDSGNFTMADWRRFQHGRRALLRELRAVCIRDDVCLAAFGSITSVDDLTFAFLTRRFDEDAFRRLSGSPAWNGTLMHREDRELLLRLLMSRLALEQSELCDGGRNPFFDPLSAQLSCICPPDAWCDDPAPSLFLINVAFVLLVILLVLRTAQTALLLRLEIIREARPLMRPGPNRTPYTPGTRDLHTADLIQ